MSTCILYHPFMSRPEHDDRKVLATPRTNSLVEHGVPDITKEEMATWETLAVKRTPEQLAETQRVVDQAIEEARSQSGRLIAGDEKEQLPTLEDFARAAKANQGSPSGRLPSMDVWGTGAGRKRE